jgi:hypothetical protein
VSQPQSALKESVSTDLDLQGVIRLGAIGARLDTANVKSRFVGGGAVEAWRDPEGLYVLAPDNDYSRSYWGPTTIPVARCGDGRLVSAACRTRR